MASTSTSTSTSTSSIHKSFKYHVYVSFSEDMRNTTFIDDLFEALLREGICTYKDDDKLKKGETIDEELLKVIEESKFFIIVFSKNYASSDELFKIIECHNTTHQTAYRLFYGVSPFDDVFDNKLRLTDESLHDGIHDFKHDRIYDGEKVGKWKQALALMESARPAEWTFHRTAVDGNEAKAIEDIVKEISHKLSFTNLWADVNLVGMEARLKDVVSLLETGFDDAITIGIKGTGGIGKTTLAKTIYGKIYNQFEGSSLVEDVREFSRTSDLASLQKKILSDVLHDGDLLVSSVLNGKSMMKEKLRFKKVLLVLDDVDHIDQLEALAGAPDWFKPGSRIIVTTRDEQVLLAHGVKFIHTVGCLSNEEAVYLFSRHAFGRDFPIQGYRELSLQAVSYTAGIPLTIRVLGSFLCGKKELQWIDALERLKASPFVGTPEILEFSYNDLEVDCKEIFLDVACLLKGFSIDEVIKILESPEFHARDALRILEKKSLITIKDYRYVVMHPLIEAVGKDIDRRVHLDDPNKHSRLWTRDEFEYVLAENLGTKEMKAIAVESPVKLCSEVVTKGFGSMKNLRLLHVVSEIDDDCDEKIGQNFPYALQFLSWEGYPHWSLPKTFLGNNLVVLEMPYSRIVQLWEGGERKILYNLKFLNLRHSRLRTLDLGLTPNLERLDLENCNHLVELYIPHVGYLESLVYANLSGCSRVKESIPEKRPLEELESRYITLPMDTYKEIFLHVACLLKGLLKDDVIRILETYYHLVKPALRFLEEASLISTDDHQYMVMGPHIEEMCKNIVRREHPDKPNQHYLLWIREEIEIVLANDLGTEATEAIAVDNAVKLSSEIVTKGFGSMKELKLLLVVSEIDDDCDEKIGQISATFPNALRFLSWEGYPHGSLPKTFDADNLVALEMPYSRITQLWEGGERKTLFRLKFLNLRHTQLRTLDLGMTPNLERLELEGCNHLVELLHTSILCLRWLVYLNLSGCSGIKSFVFIKELGSLKILSLSRLYLKEFPDIIPTHCDSRLLELRFRYNDIEQLPSSIANFQRLESLDFHSCRKLRSLPDSICGLQHLRNLKLYGCSLEELPEDIGRLGCLEKLNLSYTSIKHLPGSICKLKRLITLKLSFCRSLEKLPGDIGDLGCLEKLVLTECTQVKDIPDSICRLRNLKYLNLLDCIKLEKLPKSVGNLVSLEVLNVKGTRIRQLPPSISKLIHLEIHAPKKDRS